MRRMRGWEESKPQMREMKWIIWIINNTYKQMNMEKNQENFM